MGLSYSTINSGHGIIPGLTPEVIDLYLKFPLVLVTFPGNNVWTSSAFSAQNIDYMDSTGYICNVARSDYINTLGVSIMLQRPALIQNI